MSEWWPEKPDGGGEKFSLGAAALAAGNDESHGERRWVCAGCLCSKINTEQEEEEAQTH